MAKRIMRAFKLNEISGVDSPAQKGAVVSILKRDDGEPYWKRDFSDSERKHLASTGAAMEDGSFPIKSEKDLANAVHDWGRAGSKPDVKAHIIARARALGATDSLPDGWVGKRGDSSMSAALRKALGLPETATDAEVEAKVAKNASDALAAKAAQDAEIAKLRERLSKADMSDKHQAFCDNEGATLPKGGKAAFLAMSPAERDEHMKKNPLRSEPDGDEAAKRKFNEAVAAAVRKALSVEEVIKIGDLEVRKSDVGESTFALVKAQQTEILKERDHRELLEFQKRADTEFPALPGESLAKAKALRAISKIADEADKKAIETMLKSGNDARKGTFRVIGKDGGEGNDLPVDKLDALAKVHAAANKVSFEKAYSEVLATEEGKALYNASQVSRRGSAA